MKRVNQYEFYRMGCYVHPLTEIQKDSSLGPLIWQLNTARLWIEWLLSGRYVSIVVSKAAANTLLKAINDAIPSDSDQWFKIPQDQKIDWNKWYAVTEAAKNFETVFGAELPTIDTYTVVKKGIYSTIDLIERAEMAIDDEARSILPENIISDFQQAGRCLALELATAAGFHTMRAVEGVLRIYWRLVTGAPESKKAPVMVNCIQQLRSRNEDGKLLDILDHIRDLHRNTIMHPEEFLEMKDALRLFDIAKSAISAMADRIATLSAGPALPTP